MAEPRLLIRAAIIQRKKHFRFDPINFAAIIRLRLLFRAAIILRKKKCLIMAEPRLLIRAAIIRRENSDSHSGPYFHKIRLNAAAFIRSKTVVMI